MKLLRATFENFRLLKDVKLNFAVDPQKKLTVIRAANESGKTTILLALQWALYGDAGLPDKGVGFRLHPIDWDTAKGRRVPVTATVEFELTNVRRGPAGALLETRRQYRIVRSAVEEVDGGRTASTVKLYALNDTGASPIDPPEAFIHEELPPELREVFFTDGDRALSFIEAGVAVKTKRERVQRAIRSLLGLSVIEHAIGHVQNTASAANRQAKQVGANGELTDVSARLEQMEEETRKLEENLTDAKQQFSAFDEKMAEMDRKIAAALQKGDRDELKKKLEASQRKMRQLDEQITTANKEHTALFRAETLANDLLAPVLQRAYGKLEALHDQGKIPNQTIPVLEERLAANICICGETLEDSDPAGHTRRCHIQKLVDDSRKPDEIQEMITDLYFGVKPKLSSALSGRQWLEQYETVFKRRSGLHTMREEAGKEHRALEVQLSDVPDTDVQAFRATKAQYSDQRDRQLTRQTQYDTQLEGLRSERVALEQKRNNLLREEKKGARIRSQLEVTQDIMNVLKRSYERITTEELQKVSELMNRIFLEMIGSDPEQNSVIRRAEISPQFDIIVWGPNEKTLNPDRDLNGASRRALTLAFILALTKVSEVEAPNVIDTPLGMTSGYVKKAILRTAIRESAQLILFLTHDEIFGCEEIIDQYAGSIFTVTNSAHYPKMLVHNPGTREQKALRCECNHRKTCNTCERHTDAVAVLEPAE